MSFRKDGIESRKEAMLKWELNKMTSASKLEAHEACDKSSFPTHNVCACTHREGQYEHTPAKMVDTSIAEGSLLSTISKVGCICSV